MECASRACECASRACECASGLCECASGTGERPYEWTSGRATRTLARYSLVQKKGLFEDRIFLRAIESSTRETNTRSKKNIISVRVKSVRVGRARVFESLVYSSTRVRTLARSTRTLARSTRTLARATRTLPHRVLGGCSCRNYPNCVLQPLVHQHALQCC